MSRLAMDVQAIVQAHARNAEEYAVHRAELDREARAKVRIAKEREEAARRARKVPIQAAYAHHPNNQGCTPQEIEARYARDAADRAKNFVRAPKPIVVAAPRAKAGSKTARLLEALKRPGGATLAEMVEASGFDERNARMAMGNLRRDHGAVIEKCPGEKFRVV